jgi:hypothetical protein
LPGLYTTASVRIILQKISVNLSPGARKANVTFSKGWQPYQLVKVIIGILLALAIPVAGTIMTDAPLIWPVSILIYNLGLVFSFALVPKGVTRIVVYNLFAALFFIIESSFSLSYYLQNAGFNDAFFYHLRPDLIHAGISEFLPFLVGVIACLAGFLALLSSVLVKAQPRFSLWTPFVPGLLALGLFLSPSVKPLILHAKIFLPANKDNAVFENFRELLDPKVTIEFSKSNKPNIVLIYAEGLNQSYFDETVFPNLLPNLKRVRNQSIDFSNVAQGIGAGWTIAGMVASQCGYPLSGSYGIEGNDFSVFDEFLPRATCLGDLLEKDGYQLTFIGGADARFAGKGDFLRSHGFTSVLGSDDVLASLADKSYRNWWGAFDDTLFDFALQKFVTLSREKSPFLLSLLTLDTHGNNGYLSRSCGPYGSGDNSTLNAFHCSDLLISGFIKQIRNSPYSDNTVIIVVSDHLEFENQASHLLESSHMPDRLTFFINTPEGKKEKNTNAGLHYDIAPTILDLVGYRIRGQMGFGAPLTRGPGYLPHKLGGDKWQEQSTNLLAIGKRLWDNEVTLDQNGIKLLVKSATMIMGGRDFNLRSRGFLDVPGSTLFIFDESSLRLLEIKFYPIAQRLAPETLIEELLRHKEKLVLAMGRAQYLKGFCDPDLDPQKWVLFFGKPGSAAFVAAGVSGDFAIPFARIRELSRSKIDDRIIRRRENVLNVVRGGITAKRTDQ